VITSHIDLYYTSAVYVWSDESYPQCPYFSQKYLKCITFTNNSVCQKSPFTLLNPFISCLLPQSYQTTFFFF